MLRRRTFPIDKSNPLEKHFWYYQEDEENAVASVAYIFHHGFEIFRWELLCFGEENLRVIESQEQAETLLVEKFGKISEKEKD